MQPPPNGGMQPPPNGPWQQPGPQPMPGQQGQPGSSQQGTNWTWGAPAGGPAPNQGRPAGIADRLPEALSKAQWKVDEDGRRASVKIVLSADGEGERESDLDVAYDAEGNLAEVTQSVKGKSPDGREAEGTRTKRFKPDGSHRITFKGQLKVKGLGDVRVEWNKDVGTDGKVTGQGTMTLPNGKALPFGLNGSRPSAGKPKKWGELTRQGFKPGQGGGATDDGARPGIKPGEGTIKPGELPGLGRGCSPDDEKLGMSGKAPCSSVLNIQITDDRMVMAGGTAATISFVGTGTHLGQELCTYVNVFDGQRNSDPSTGGNAKFGTTSGATYDADGLNGTVSLDPSTLSAGSYWLRFSTKMKDGTWEVAEGVLMVH
jgi:hypothetical protein